MPLFTVSLNYRNPGFYDFGFIDKHKYTGDIQYFPVPSNLPTPNLWGVSLTAITVGYLPTGVIRFSGGIPTFIDSGGAFIFLPQEVCDRYYKQAPYAKEARVDVNHNGNPSAVHLYPCDDGLPDLTVFVGENGYKATIPGKLLRGAQHDDNCKCTINLQMT